MNKQECRSIKNKRIGNSSLILYLCIYIQKGWCFSFCYIFITTYICFKISLRFSLAKTDYDGEQKQPTFSVLFISNNFLLSQLLRVLELFRLGFNFSCSFFVNTRLFHIYLCMCTLKSFLFFPFFLFESFFNFNDLINSFWFDFNEKHIWFRIVANFKHFTLIIFTLRLFRSHHYPNTHIISFSSFFLYFTVLIKIIL